jgi:glycosyltransferase involved in cell wall biosynthesis
MSKIIYLGGIFFPSQIDEIISSSTGNIQNAADSLQKNFLKGLVQASGKKIALVNLPFVGSFPRRYRRIIFPAASEFLYGGVDAKGVAFINLQYVKFLGRFFSALVGLRSLCSTSSNTIIIYSAHLPFIFAALVFKLTRRDSHLCLILPDFPEFMGEGGLAYRSLKAVESAVFRRTAKYIDFFVVLTAYMPKRLGVSDEKYVVVEGIVSDAQPRPSKKAHDTSSRIFLYSGTLAARYGMLDLVKAFESLKNPGIELWICGEGDSKLKIIEAANKNPNIKFLGQLPREKVMQLQATADVLVNPRRPVGEFTLYSFPSKTLEYLAAGRLVVMHALPGVPDEYDPYILLSDTPDQEGLARALLQAASMDDKKLRDIGAAGRRFVMENKTPAVQCRKVLELIGG